MQLALGAHGFDITDRAVVVGILNHTPDSFLALGCFDVDRLLTRADRLVAEGADALDIGGVGVGPGPEVTESEELDRIVPAIEVLAHRFDVPIWVETRRSGVIREAAKVGASVANDLSGFDDPDYLAVASELAVSVVETNIRLAPRRPDHEAEYRDGLVPTVVAFLVARAGRAEAAGIPATRIILDAGLDRGMSAPESIELLRASDRLAGLGYPLLLSASNTSFLGARPELGADARSAPTVAAHALGVALGCRLLRAHDVKPARRTADVLAEILAARRQGGP